MSATVELEVPGEVAQAGLGRALADLCVPPLLIFLEGELGAGKTTLVRGLLQALGHTGRVKSPTYTLVEPYEIGDLRAYHLDLYRVADPEELEFLGLREVLAESALILVEWPHRGEGWLPAPDLRIAIAHAGEGRRIALTAAGPLAERVRRAVVGFEGDLQ